MNTRGNTNYYKKRSNHNGGRLLPFPITISTVLLAVTLLSTLLALYIGGHRGKSNSLTLDDVYHNAISVGNQPMENANTRKDNDANFSTNNDSINHSNGGPQIQSLQDLTQSEKHPKAGQHRYMVSPPKDDQEHPVTLVTCTTTAGYLHILVHPAWAPIGAERFLDMVNTGYFSSKVALMRCIKNFLCQFGIAGIPSETERYSGQQHKMIDDRNWLPERTNELGVKRFAKGFLAYAGAGPNTRGVQLIVALDDNPRLAGGSPWEVPWGEVVGEESFHTLDHIYTGYGEKGPSQGRLRNEGSSEGIKKDFPNLDYILDCNVIDTE